MTLDSDNLGFIYRRITITSSVPSWASLARIKDKLLQEIANQEAQPDLQREALLRDTKELKKSAKIIAKGAIKELGWDKL